MLPSVSGTRENVKSKWLWWIRVGGSNGIDKSSIHHCFYNVLLFPHPCAKFRSWGRLFLVMCSNLGSCCTNFVTQCYWTSSVSSSLSRDVLFHYLSGWLMWTLSKKLQKLIGDWFFTDVLCYHPIENVSWCITKVKTLLIQVVYGYFFF